MKDLGGAYFVLGIQVHRDRTPCILGLSPKNYIDRALSKFDMKDCAPEEMPTAKGDKSNLS